MATSSQRPEAQNNVLSTLDIVIQTLNLAKDACGIPPAQIAFGSAGVLLTMIRNSTTNKRDYVELGLTCADVCKALDRGLDGRQLDELSLSVLSAVDQLTTTVAGIQNDVAKQGKRTTASRLFHANSDKDTITAWRQDLSRILHVFNTELLMNNHMMLVDIHRNLLMGQEGINNRDQPTQISTPLGEIPPPPPRACFGREELIGRIVGLVENLIPIALIGVGGIGKTSVALTVLHHDRVKERFGDDRRFIRCDQFPASRTNFLNRLSKVIGAGVENPEDLTPLRHTLSSKEIFIILDNVESSLDPQGTDGQDIYDLVEELSRFPNICLCITSRITTVPPDCETLEIPTLSMEAARDTFYRIYKRGGQSDTVNDILKQLDFHPLSVTLLATVAHQNRWDSNRLAQEWGQRQTAVLQTGRNRSLANMIELSLTSSMFKELGPDARGLLEVVAFFPQGIDENNLGWLFPTIRDATTIFDTFCILSLTFRHNGFSTMLAPLRDYLSPKDPMSSPLLRTTKECYFARMSIEFDRNGPAFGKSRWIVSEDVNVEHLLDVFSSADANLDDVWEAFSNFFRLLNWHKPRYTVLRAKVEGIPDDHHSKLKCLVSLARLFASIGNHAGGKIFLNQSLKLSKKQGDIPMVALALVGLSSINRVLGLYKEGIQFAMEAWEIAQRIDGITGEALHLNGLAWLLYSDNQLDAAEEVISRAIGLLPRKGEELWACQSHRLLGLIRGSKGEREEAVRHHEVALNIASSFNWHDELFWIHYALACLSSSGGKFEDAHAHIERAKSHTVNHEYIRGRALELQAFVLYRQRRFEEALPEGLRALEIFESLGTTSGIEHCRTIVRSVQAHLHSTDQVPTCALRYPGFSAILGTLPDPPSL